MVRFVRFRNIYKVRFRVRRMTCYNIMLLLGLGGGGSSGSWWLMLPSSSLSKLDYYVIEN